MTGSSAIDQLTINAFLETHYCVLGKSPFVLRIGIPNESLSMLYKQYRSNCAAFITACNPYSQNVGEIVNQHRQSELANELNLCKLLFIDGIGHHPSNEWPGEPSYLVIGLSLEAAKALGNEYEQNAIIWCDVDAVPELVLLR